MSSSPTLISTMPATTVTWTWRRAKGRPTLVVGRREADPTVAPDPPAGDLALGGRIRRSSLDHDSSGFSRGEAEPFDRRDHPDPLMGP
jgi:hypothetical protein